jgi:hypothetical protein
LFTTFFALVKHRQTTSCHFKNILAEKKYTYAVNPRWFSVTNHMQVKAGPCNTPTREGEGRERGREGKRVHFFNMGAYAHAT